MSCSSTSIFMVTTAPGWGRARCRRGLCVCPRPTDRRTSRIAGALQARPSGWTIRCPPCLLPHAMPSRNYYGDVLQLRADLWRVPFSMCLGAVALFLVTVLIDREASHGALHLP